MTFVRYCRGRIPTTLEQEKEIRIVAPDTVEGARVVGSAPEFYLDGEKGRMVTPRVIKGDADTVKVSAVNVRGGLSSATVRLN
jgi:hypothetical protein